MRLADLFSCAGGAGMGYHQAGFEVVGFDRGGSAVSRNVERLTVNLAPDVADALRRIAAIHGDTVTDAVRRCISTQLFIDEQRFEGVEVLLFNGRDYKAVVWP